MSKTNQSNDLRSRVIDNLEKVYRQALAAGDLTNARGSMQDIAHIAGFAGRPLLTPEEDGQ